ncbi:MAG: type II toxin-antitoxin system VapC family toxin [Propionibacteriaceae bacterium]|jgi:predicted nucleic acid-binding protein|nr:type II toxin-antitoxin system VapC family toxin [Propionibacteriaceae bacterium]
MIGYFDTSAIVPLVIAEPGSARCAQLWTACDIRVASMLVVAEAHAALALALRIERLTAVEHRSAVALLNRRLNELDLVSPTREIVDLAAELALSQSLRGYDAVHAATAVAVRAPDLVVISGDQALLSAATGLGLATSDSLADVRL